MRGICAVLGGVVLIGAGAGDAAAQAGGGWQPPVYADTTSFTERELTVLRLLPTRLSTREIARELHVSPNTVRSHVQAIYRKLQVNSRAEAVTHGRQLGLLPKA